MGAFSALGDCAELVPLGAMAPLLDARTANGEGRARIEKRKDGLFVAEPEVVPRPATTSRRSAQLNRKVDNGPTRR